MAVERDQNQMPGTIRASQVLLWLSAGIWFVLGGFSLFGEPGDDSSQVATLVVIATLMFANSAMFIVVGLGLGIRRPWAWWLAVVVVIANLLLTFTDQIGFYDITTAVVDAAILALLVSGRSWFRSPPSAPAGS